MTQALIDQEMYGPYVYEIWRLRKALQVCEHTLHRREPTDAEMHAAQQASGAWSYHWRPQDVATDLPDFTWKPIDGD